MVFQSYALFPNMSVADNIGYGLKIRGVGSEERAARVAELVALTNISGLENRRIDQLSGGQRQRVALARAVAIRPGILLLDEPLTALDAALRDRLRGELNRLLRALGITTIYVTHDQSEAMELGDRIVVMRKGAIAQIGTPRDIYFAPKSRFVAEFIGAANIIEAPVENGHLVLPGGRQPIGSDAKPRGRGRHDPARNHPRGRGRRRAADGDHRQRQLHRRPPAHDRQRRVRQASHARRAEYGQGAGRRADRTSDRAGGGAAVAAGGS